MPGKDDVHPGYRFIDHTADVAFEALGKSAGELFENSAYAVFETMVDTGTIDADQEFEIVLSAPDIEQLLFDFLSELVFLKDAECTVLKTFRVSVTGGDDWSLAAHVCGETVNPEKHELRVDVKAVTLHKFSVKETDDGFRAFVILDI